MILKQTTKEYIHKKKSIDKLNLIYTFSLSLYIALKKKTLKLSDDVFFRNLEKSARINSGSASLYPPSFA